MTLQRAVVPEMTMCVTFGAPRFGAKFRNFCACSEYATFSTISAPPVRGITLCVAFGAPLFGFSGATWGQPAVDQVGGVSHGSGFRDLRRNFFIGRRLAAH